MDNTVSVVLTGLQQLREAEQMAVEGAAMVTAGSNLIGIAAHRISTQKLYMEDVNPETGKPYATFKEYIPGLIRKMGVSRSTIFEAMSDVKLAMGPTFNVGDYDTFTQLGGITAFRALRDYIEDYNQITGEVRAWNDNLLLPPDLPDDMPVGRYILEQMEHIAPASTGDNGVEPKTYRKQLSEAINVNGAITRPIVRFFDEEVGDEAKIRIGYYVERPNQAPERGWLDEGEVPYVVIQEYRRRLNILPKEE